MFNNENHETLAKILKLALIQVPIFILTIIIYSLSIYILNDTITSASIATPQLINTDLSLNAIFISFIVLTVIHLLTHIGLFYVNESGVVLLIVAILNVIINLIAEALFFKLAISISFSNNSVIIARSSLVILLMVFLICLSLIPIGYTRLSGEKRRYALVLAPLLILPSIVMFALNVILIARFD
jgi:hypothetical protein